MSTNLKENPPISPEHLRSKDSEFLIFRQVIAHSKVTQDFSLGCVWIFEFLGFFELGQAATHHIFFIELK
ncbi:MAG: hypothetical protein SchgKO_23640 [Schleiferiaceae bacterium]